jgi:hypothetical protein
MKRILVLVMVLGLVFGAIATADAKKKKKKKKKPVRVEEVIEVEYQGGNLGAATPAATGGACLVDPTMPFSCKSVTPTVPGMKYLKIEVLDVTGLNAGGFISQQDSDGDGLQDGYGEFCGAHADPITLELPNAPVGVSLYPGVCSDGSGPSIVTMGTIVATFSNLP